MNPLFSNSDHEQTYHEQSKIINSTNGDDQINSNIIFDDPNVEVNDESIEHDKNAHDQHDNELELLVRSAYKEAEKQNILPKKVKQQNVEDIIRALEKERDDLQLNVSEQSKQVLELKTAHTSLKYKRNKAEDTYLDDVLNFEAKLKKNENVQAISENPKLYDASYLHSSKVHANVRDTKEILKDATKRLKDVSSVRRPSSKGSSSKNSVLSNTKNQSEDVEVHVRTNKKTNVTSKNNVVQTKKIVTNVDVKNALKAKDVIYIILWIIDSGCLKHMTDNLKLLKNFVENFIGIVRLGNVHFVAIIGYDDFVHGNVTKYHVYYVEGLGHNLFSIGQFCDGDLEVSFCSKTCYVRNPEGDDLLTGAHESNLYMISILDMSAYSPACLMSKASSTKS
ncbi:hypothetical protein Tco_0949691 [Tanacetum coccineum]